MGLKIFLMLKVKQKLLKILKENVWISNGRKSAAFIRIWRHDNNVGAAAASA